MTNPIPTAIKIEVGRNKEPLDWKKVRKVAKAIAWTTLTDHGRLYCLWPEGWSHSEVLKFESMAIAAMEALDD